MSRARMSRHVDNNAARAMGSHVIDRPVTALIRQEARDAVGKCPAYALLDRATPAQIKAASRIDRTPAECWAALEAMVGP